MNKKQNFSLKGTKREEFLLWKLLEFTICRYLLANSRFDGCERAERHIEMSKIIWEYIFCKTYFVEFHEEMMKIHDTIAMELTDDMPKHIGFDFRNKKAEHDFDLIADKFFKKLLTIKFEIPLTKTGE